jgi:hypothetical protein
MALVSRYIVEVSDGSFVSAAPRFFEDWVESKLSRNGGSLPEEIKADGRAHQLANGWELREHSGEADGLAGFRASLYEPREADQVGTTFTALSNGTEHWGWVDLERWSADPFRPGWVPSSPRLVTSILDSAECFRGPTRLAIDFEEVVGAEGEDLALRVLVPDRNVPIVVVTPTREELDGGLAPAQDRATGLQHRLRGIAPVVMLGKGAVASFSRTMLRAGENMDVHSGAVRTYLPGVGNGRDFPRRHRLIPFRRLQGRPTEVAAQLVSLPVMRAACQAVPPPLWAGGGRDLVSARGRTDEELGELLDLAEAEKSEAERRAEAAEGGRAAAELDLEVARDSEAEVLAEHEQLRSRLEYAQNQIREAGSAPVEPTEPAPIPEFCSEAIDLAEAHCPGVVLGEQVRATAESLDEHAEPSWTLKAWRSFQALQAYVDSKQDRDDGPSGFFFFCDKGEHAAVIPTSWISSNESETTDQNQAFRGQRTFPVPKDVDPSGEVYMPAHIKIEKGGYPAPRIHFHDDTDGATGKVHVGWFGPHLDSKSKN